MDAVAGSEPSGAAPAAASGRGAGRLAVGAVVGLLTAAVALGVGELVAAFVRPAAAPVIAVGNRVVLLTPEPAKRWATSTFGTSDKQVLVGGVYLVVALCAVLVGILALRRLAFGLAGVGLCGALGGFSALTATGGGAGDAVPTIVATLAALALLTVLVRRAGTDAEVAERSGGPLADRRGFLQASATAAGLAAVAGFGGRVTQRARFDVARQRAQVALPPPVAPAPASPAAVDLGRSGVPWATPNSDFYRIDTALSVPQVSPKSWSLRIHGQVDREVTLTYDQLLARPLIERWITLCCVSNDVGGNLIGNARFLGARLADLLREAGVHAAADQLLMRSADGMTIGAPTAAVLDGRDALVAVGMNGVPLPVEHGFPARIVVPGLYGYTSACKWVVAIEATTFRAQQAYWVRGGWQPHPPIALASRIDTPSGGRMVPVGAPVAVAGVAWDQHVGVSAVQVQVDQGPWANARLAAVPSVDTWRQWVLPWTPPRAGAYTLRVRAIDATGNPQSPQRRPPFPGAASGLHTITVRAR